MTSEDVSDPLIAVWFVTVSRMLKTEFRGQIDAIVKKKAYEKTTI